ncbi:MAG TPA: GNAT family N-acetyltransferase [Candidatus Krumholzibacteria bacterium]|nr:GNAT family N-acetyltransferase [Candidatus Krumholzibacteria bacterium]
MTIEVLDSFPVEIDALAETGARATFYHTRVWLESLAVAYPRMRPRCALARDGGTVRGFLPFFESPRGPLRSVWSLPFGTYGGPVGDGDGVEHALLDVFDAELRRPGTLEAGWVDFHNRSTGATGTVETATTHVLDLRGGFDTVWRERFDKPRRRRVRRAEEKGVEVRRAGGEADIHGFLQVYRQRLDAWDSGEGHPERLFHDLVARGGDGRVRMFVAVHAGEVVGGHLNLYHGRSVIAWYGMASAAGDELNAGTLLYAHCIRDACDGGYEDYNLGASLGKESLIAYKESLGGVARHYRIIRRRRLAGRVAGALRNLRKQR